MGEDHQSPPSSRRKHQRLSDEASDDDHKRRKRHHHRHHRPHHHHSKHERNRDEQEGEVIVIEKILKRSSQLKLADDEREEGEIFEEEEEEEGGWERPAFAMEDVSEVESGEIKMDDATTVPIKEPSLDEDLLQEHQLDNLSTGNDLGILNCCEKENDRDGETLFESTRDNPNNTAEYGYLAEGETRNNFEHQDGSRSSVSEESAYKSKHIDMDDHLSRYSECISEKEEVNEKRRSINNSRSTYPRSSEEKPFEAMQLSLSEAGNRDQTASDDYTTGGKLYLQVRDVDAENCIQRSHSERLNKERNISDFERIHKHGKLDKYTNRNQNVDNEFHEEREGSLYDNHDLHDYRHKSRDRGREVLDRRHGSKDRHMEVEKCNNAYKDSYRNKSHNSSEFIEHIDRNDSRYRDRDRFEGQYGEEDRYRESEKYRRRVRERVKDRDLSRDRSRERRRVRNAKGEGDRERERERDNNDRDKSRIGDRKTNSFNERERVNQRDRDRRGKHDLQMDYRLSKHEDTDYRKERTKTRSDVINSHVLEESKQNSLREEEEKDYQGRIEQQLAKQDEENIEKIKEESRKRRQAILEKYKQRQNQQHLKPPPNFHGKELFSMKSEVLQQVPQKIVGVSSIEELAEHYDNSDAHIVDPSFIVGKSPVQNGFSVPVNSGFTCALGEGSPKSERSTDMFCDDIFGDSPAGVRKVGKDDIMKVDGNGLHDNWDDAEGYYSYRLGEVLDGRYEVIAAHGKGVFSTVVRAKDLKGGKSDPEEVAIKIIRSNDTMYKAGMEELVILKKLAGADPEDKRHCVRFLSSFKYRNHLCLVFESLNMNLREVLKKFGRNIGLRLTAVRAYAKQLFIALKHLRNCGVLHCDIKPDNMLVNEAKNVLKLCDFGNAMFAGKNDVTPYLVSRFYRAPEIILGLTYDHPLDIWSVGCCLFELYTGKVLFPGPSNNDMLRLHMELKGPFPKKMLRKGAFIDQHFDQDLNFHATEDDPVTKKTVKRMLLNIKPKDIGTLISGSPGEDPKMLANFKDLLDRIFVLDPEKRITVSQALSHPFITGK